MTDEGGVDLTRLRGRAWYHASRRRLAAVAAEIGIGAAALSAFVKGGAPGPRTAAKLRAWFAAAEAAPWTPARRVRRAEIVRVVLREHARNGIPAPPHLRAMLAEAEGAAARREEDGAWPATSSGS